MAPLLPSFRPPIFDQLFPIFALTPAPLGVCPQVSEEPKGLFLLVFVFYAETQHFFVLFHSEPSVVNFFRPPDALPPNPQGEVAGLFGADKDGRLAKADFCALVANEQGLS